MIKKVMNITKDRVVSIDYTLTDVNGQILDSSTETGPLMYLHGHENIVSGLEKALEGRFGGDALKVTVPAAEGYGLRDEQLVMNVPLERFQGAEVVEAGMQFEAETADGNRIVTITKVAAGMATVDANHPLAGIDLTFDVKVVSVRESSDVEREHGHVHGEHAHSHDDHDCDCGDDGCDDEGGCGCGGCH